MKKKINQAINIIMAAFIGVFIGHGIFLYLDYKNHSDLYMIQSAPWYTGILVYGIGTLAVLAICIGIKIVLKRKTDKPFKNQNK
ncbi:hypothetical protein [Anaerotignum lactatifermentans]|uniref:hypothetical protein n=1 Tax=Anaerotignum lactatifermentans TaxID=160404 RepID=UPI00242F7602|nr:hypothetical protein [Anaerotignum lactatifermentans]